MNTLKWNRNFKIQKILFLIKDLNLKDSLDVLGK